MQAVLSLFHLAVGDACGTNVGFLPSLYDKVCGVDANGVKTIQIDSISDVLIVIGNVARILIAISGALAVIIIIVGAIFYITSMGDPGRIKRAKDILINTSIGLVVIVAAYTVVTFIAGEF